MTEKKIPAGQKFKLERPKTRLRKRNKNFVRELADVQEIHDEFDDYYDDCSICQMMKAQVEKERRKKRQLRAL